MLPHSEQYQPTLYYGFLSDFSHTFFKENLKIEDDSSHRISNNSTGWNVKNVSRSILRRVLLKKINSTQPLEFSYSPNGKPYVREFPASFNVSHTENSFAIAIATELIGVDIEKKDRAIDYDKLCELIFSPDDLKTFQYLEKEQKQLAFINSWTRKEALIKAMSGSISLPMDQIEISMGDETFPKIKTIYDQTYDQECWTMHNVKFIHEHVCSVAVKTRKNKLKVIQLNQQYLEHFYKF